MAEEQLVVQKRKGRFTINWAKSSGYILAMALLYFLFFGFICNSGGSVKQQDPGNKLLFVYTAFFNTDLLTFNSLSIPGIIESKGNREVIRRHVSQDPEILQTLVL